mmetsp:Transcript_39409/g.101012  ORF Transcript_39409/g.101012 Transcript_39409/m.101012 type:complete len:94 (+) Transcript_39409:234-515(+)
MTVLTYILAPFPVLLGKMCKSDTFGDEISPMLHWGLFTTSWIVVSTFGLPAAMAYLQVICWQSLLITLAGSIIIYGSLLGFVIYRQKKDSSPF